MMGSAQAREKVQQRPTMPLHQRPERIRAPRAHLRHQGEVVGFGLDGIGHEQAFLDQLRAKEKPFGKRRLCRKNGLNRRRRNGVYTGLKLGFRKGNAA
jgi:hypothetical protein